MESLFPMKKQTKGLLVLAKDLYVAIYYYKLRKCVKETEWKS